jgi:hypothetical protein
VIKVEHFHLVTLTHAEIDSDNNGSLDTRLHYTPHGEISSSEKL